MGAAERRERWKTIAWWGLAALVSWWVAPSWRWFVGLLVALGAVVVGVLAYLINDSLPATVTLEPVTDDSLTPSFRQLVERFEALGFRSFGPPYRTVGPPLVSLPLMHDHRHAFATVHMPLVGPPTVGFGITSLLGDGSGAALESCAKTAAGNLPFPEILLLQIFDGESPEVVFQRHNEALAALSSRGLCVHPVGPEAIHARAAFLAREVGRFFRKAPIRRTVVMLWRMLVGTNPHHGSITSQPSGERRIHALLTGRSEQRDR